MRRGDGPGPSARQGPSRNGVSSLTAYVAQIQAMGCRDHRERIDLTAFDDHALSGLLEREVGGAGVGFGGIGRRMLDHAVGDAVLLEEAPGQGKAAVGCWAGIRGAHAYTLALRGHARNRKGPECAAPRACGLAERREASARLPARIPPRVVRSPVRQKRSGVDRAAFAVLARPVPCWSPLSAG